MLLNVGNVFALFGYNLSLETGMAPSLKKLKSLFPQDCFLSSLDEFGLMVMENNTSIFNLVYFANISPIGSKEEDKVKSLQTYGQTDRSMRLE